MKYIFLRFPFFLVIWRKPVAIPNPIQRILFEVALPVESHSNIQAENTIIFREYSFITSGRSKILNVNRIPLDTIFTLPHDNKEKDTCVINKWIQKQEHLPEISCFHKKISYVPRKILALLYPYIFVKFFHVCRLWPSWSVFLFIFSSWI